ncbi:MAG: patatin-like phospholipase family protein [Rhodospirillales bacterium]|nr:patatin-like phospholipase family protein [Rhodospirillales bacterium]
MPKPTQKKRTEKKTLNLALQGGGAHGAFTWGVVDALLEDGRFAFEGITATSAGSMNAVVLTDGFMKGGVQGARAALENFWREISNAGAVWGVMRPSTWDAFECWMPFLKFLEIDDLNDSFALGMGEAMNWTFSPYQTNPLNLNPLRDILNKTIDFDAVNRCRTHCLFISATNVRTGSGKVFRTGEIMVETLLASAALPNMFQAVEIGGESYWDGGYVGNPSLWPLFYESACRDILLVHINPIVRPEIPRRGYAIQNRLNEITFNASLLKELRAIAFVRKLVTDDMLRPEHKKKYRDILMHAIRTDTVMNDLSIASKYDTSWNFLTTLRDLGRKQAQEWVRKNYTAINVRPTVNLHEDYLNA